MTSQSEIDDLYALLSEEQRDSVGVGMFREIGESFLRQLGIPFTDLSGLVRPGSADDLAIWRWSDSDRLLGEPVEKQSAGL